ncbi:MAG TPA: XRE family transcriptional regulator [Terracidiphilus sp.]|jgi:transcriptional regulator with XRE-family HTH domain|nr:XRE family transcriptional regulator [Terracidiphilus sp.]
MVALKTTSPEWSNRIRRLLVDLKLTQARLGERLGVSPPTVSRWIQGRHEPTAESYIALGNLAGRPDGVYFWERAGMDTSGLQDASFLRAISSLRVSLRDFQLIAGKKVSHHLAGKGNAVAIPLLNVTAYGDRIPPKENVSLSQVEVEDVLLAPLSWCPHPENMISMHLQGDSMFPLIAPDSIIFVDTVMTDREGLNRRLTVVAHRDLGFKVARFQRLTGFDLLVSANHKYVPLDVSNASKWKIFGEVLWWISRDIEPTA